MGALRRRRSGFGNPPAVKETPQLGGGRKVSTSGKNRSNPQQFRRLLLQQGQVPVPMTLMMLLRSLYHGDSVVRSIAASRRTTEAPPRPLKQAGQDPKTHPQEPGTDDSTAGCDRMPVSFWNRCCCFMRGEADREFRVIPEPAALDTVQIRPEDYRGAPDCIHHTLYVECRVVKAEREVERALWSLYPRCAGGQQL